MPSRRLAFRTGLSFALVAAVAMLSAEALGFWWLDRFVTSPTQAVPPLVVAAAEERARVAAPLLEGASPPARAAWLEQLSSAYWPVLNGTIVMVGEGSAQARLETSTPPAPTDCTSPLEGWSVAAGETRSCRRGHGWWVATPVPGSGTLVLELEPATSVGLIRTGWVVLSLVTVVPIVCIALPVGFLIGLLITGRQRARLGRIVDAASRWAAGTPWPPLDDGAKDELGVVARTLDALGHRVHEHVERETAMVAEAERQRLSDELHDHAKQSVFAASVRLGALEQHVAEAQRANVTSAIDALQSALADMGRLVSAPEASTRLAHVHLQAVSQQVARLWSTPIETKGPPFELDVRAHEVSAIVREALTNAMKHAGGAAVRLEWVLVPNALEVLVADGGSGFSSPPAAGHGLASMRARAESLDATLRVDTSGAGTRVTLRLPGAVT